jgi:hypothetical protein
VPASHRPGNGNRAAGSDKLERELFPIKSGNTGIAETGNF